MCFVLYSQEKKLQEQVFPESILKGIVTTWFPAFEMDSTFQKILCILADQKHI